MCSPTSGGCPGSSARTSPPGRAFTRAGQVLAGRATRWILLAASVAGGLVIAAMTVHLAGPWVGFHHKG